MHLICIYNSWNIFKATKFNFFSASAETLLPGLSPKKQVASSRSASIQWHRRKHFHRCWRACWHRNVCWWWVVFQWIHVTFFWHLVTISSKHHCWLISVKRWDVWMRPNWSRWQSLSSWVPPSPEPNSFQWLKIIQKLTASQAFSPKPVLPLAMSFWKSKESEDWKLLIAITAVF